MFDANHQWGNDLQLSPTGDIALVDGTIGGQQRVLRRLLTNATDYLWHLEYGAGLPGMVGQPADGAAIEGIIRAQMALEAVVQQQPEPTITTRVQNDGTVYVHITYVDAPTGTTQVLSFQVAP